MEMDFCKMEQKTFLIYVSNIKTVKNYNIAMSCHFFAIIEKINEVSI